MKSRVSALLVACVGALGPSAVADLTLTETGAATLGKLTTLELTGNPNAPYAVFISLVNQPFPLPPPHIPSLDIVLAPAFLVNLTFILPGFFGTLDAAGKRQIPLFFPPDISLNPLVIYFQAIEHDGAVFLDKSNVCALTPNIALFPELTQNDMSVLRAGHATIELPDGKVLLIGGGPDGLVASYGQTAIDLYDPCTQKFTKVGDLSQARVSHTATRLNDGRILVTGGADDVLGEPVDTAEVIDPNNNYASTPTLNNLGTARALHTANKLADGRVILMGGTSSFNNPQAIIEGATNTTLIYDPVTNMFSPGPNMDKPRIGHTATTLQSGTILVAGGFSWTLIVIFKIPFITDTAQIYTPLGGNPGTFGPSMTMTGDRFAHSAIRVDDGSVLLFGGGEDSLSDPLNPQAVNTVERYDPVAKTFSPFGTMSVARGVCAVAKQPGDVRVIVAGGGYGTLASPTPDDTVDIFDSTTGATVTTFKMAHVRANFSNTALKNGAFLLAGGGEEPDPQNPTLAISYGDAEVLTVP